MIVTTGGDKRRGEIKRLIEKVSPYLANADTFDVLVNPPQVDGEGCTVWVDSAGGGMRNTGLVLDPIEVRNLNRSVGSELGRPIDDQHPILMGELPWNGARVTALNYPITRHGPALCLRKPSSRLLTLDDYVESGALDGSPPARKAVLDPPRIGHRAVIEYGITVGWNMLIAGSNAAGKTTFKNAIGVAERQHAPDRRLYIIEDLEELNPQALPDNVLRVQPCEELGISETDLLKIGLRVRCDGIIVAELLRPQAAYSFFSAMNTGISASSTTIHANSAHEALVRCETLIEQVPGIVVSPRMIASAIDLVVFVARLSGGARRITEVARVNKHGSHTRGHYDLDYIEADPHALLERQVA